MSTVISRWKAILAGYEADERAAKAQHTQAQAALEKARAADLHPREALVQARDRASAALLRAREGEAYAKRVIARHDVPPLKCERTVWSPNFSSRRGVKMRLIVVHITVSRNVAGLTDLDAIGNYFASRSSQVSSHVVNDREGHDMRCVHDLDKAWTCAAYNAPSLNIEQIEDDVNRTRAQWLGESLAQINNTARWVAHWSLMYGIPLKHSTSAGVCQHRELGAAGGGHTDCGQHYPLDIVISKAAEYAAALKS